MKKRVLYKLEEVSPYPIGIAVKCPACGKENLLIAGWQLSAFGADTCEHICKVEGWRIEITDMVDEKGNVFAEIAFNAPDEQEHDDCAIID